MLVYIIAVGMAFAFLFAIMEWDSRPDYVGSVKTFLTRLYRTLGAGLLGFFLGAVLVLIFNWLIGHISNMLS